MTENLEGRIARFADIAEDTEAFKDVQDPENRRVVKYLVARHSSYAPIQTRNDLTVAILESMPGKGPKLHAHDYPEIFFCQEGQFGIVWGDHGEHCVTLNPLDTFAVPPGINRQVMNTGDVPGKCMVLFDTTRTDPNEGITLPEHEIVAELASGKSYERRALAGVPMTPEEVAAFVALYDEVDLAGQDGAHAEKRIIAPGDPDAAISAPHDLTMRVLESMPGDASADTVTASDELLIALSDDLSLVSGDEDVVLSRYDTATLPAGVMRRIVNTGSEPARILVVGKP
jgi:mannose-6-phosphate isomerase-like protein (cupin superfamily)